MYNIDGTACNIRGMNLEITSAEYIYNSDIIP